MTRPQGGSRQPTGEFPIRQLETLHFDSCDTGPVAPFQATYGAVYDEHEHGRAEPNQVDRAYQQDRADNRPYQHRPYQQTRNLHQSMGSQYQNRPGVYQPDRWNASPRSSPGRDSFQLQPPRPLYIGYSCDPYTTSGRTVPKLLVLDLNGALVYRTDRGSFPRTAYPRPFLTNFLSYLFGNDPDGRGYEVLVWSSAQPHNVRSMVESTFEPEHYRGVWETELEEDKEDREARGKGRLLDVWARDKMGLSQAAYRQEVQTVKDLRKVTDEHTTYDEKTTVLLDDSPLKAMHQPWSQVIIPEYDRPELMDARRAAEHLWATTTDFGMTPTTEDGSEEPRMDNILLGVIGILEAMRSVNNVPGWVRAGHLNTPEEITEHPGHDVTLADLPSDFKFVPWFKNMKTHAYWVKRGKAALARRGIPVTHGLMPDGHGATAERLEAYKNRQQGMRSSDQRPEQEAEQAEPVPKEGSIGKRKDSTKRRVQRQGSKVEGADGKARSVRKGSVSDEPRDDLPPGAKPSPFFVTSRKTSDTTLPGRKYTTRAVTSDLESPVSDPMGRSPEPRERAYSPSMPV
ncbi:hypothetical protein CspeluHIS016_0111060 [Cutaneotrichosporon spelunceum]|uniref:Mitochondrial import inner membrane translocase subunit TIM50 n=1 Tax=Cutaneotrichosporon spelunceum TaxID=1672016 RepID=A0AAD3TQG9_9TREE|nr:hypothetical protein CspeluHIS016_0111060 [Cutaneotrichosporon spelunceum]